MVPLLLYPASAPKNVAFPEVEKFPYTVNVYPVLFVCPYNLPVPDTVKFLGVLDEPTTNVPLPFPLALLILMKILMKH